MLINVTTEYSLDFYIDLWPLNAEISISLLFFFTKNDFLAPLAGRATPPPAGCDVTPSVPFRRPAMTKWLTRAASPGLD